MSLHAFTEDQLVEQPAVALFAELGWTMASASDEVFGPKGTLQRETKGDVVLASRLRLALERLNPGLPAEAISAAVDELSRDRSAMPLAAANREVYLHLKDGTKVSVPDWSLRTPTLTTTSTTSSKRRTWIQSRKRSSTAS